MEAFINGMGIISPQKTYQSEGFLNEIITSSSNILRCIEPDYKRFLDPAAARRMSRTIKMSLAAAKSCLEEAGISMPDAIITGTSLGCAEATEKFLTSIIQDKEMFLTPTSFMQSTPNTVSAQIALYLQCMNYNMTFVHKGFSFESAILDGLMQLEEGEAQNILLGSHDEFTENNFNIYNRTGLWKNEELERGILYSETSGTIAGEGAAFFVLSNVKSDNYYARIRGARSMYKPASANEIEIEIDELLESNNLNKDNIDLVIYGINGDIRYDAVYDNFMNGYFKEKSSAYFKHLCGEYQTASSFALWMASMIIQSQNVPDVVLIGKQKLGIINNILIYNSVRDIAHSVILVSK